jgi:hypothetical protein
MNIPRRQAKITSNSNSSHSYNENGLSLGGDKTTNLILFFFILTLGCHQLNCFFDIIIIRPDM